MNAVSDKWLQAAPYVEFYYNDTRLAKASGFLWRSQGDVRLISNWHNFSGRDPNTLQPISAHGGCPNRIRINFFVEGAPYISPTEDGLFQLDEFSGFIRLFEDDDLTPVWFEHETFGRKVDLASISMKDDNIKNRFLCANDLDSDAIRTTSRFYNRIPARSGRA